MRGRTWVVLCLVAAAAAPSDGSDRSDRSDEAFLDLVESNSCLFYVEKIHPGSGLNTEDGKISHIGSNGFGLTVLCIAAERGWLLRDEAARRVLKILETFQTRADKLHGAFGWIMDAATASDHVYGGGYDIVETAYVCAGALTCKQYFNRRDETEQKIRDLADEIYRGVEWDAFQSDPDGKKLNTLAWSYDRKKKCFSDFRVVGYHEAMIVYILALGSPTHPASPNCWNGWTRNYLWLNRYGYSYYFCPALFTHQYSQAWLDLRKAQDKQTRRKNITYFENSRRAALSHIAYAEANPKHFPGYGPIWGLTDCGCPLHPNGFGGHGLSTMDSKPADDDGTIAVSAAGGSMPFVPEESIAFLRLVYKRYGDRMFDRYGFHNAFNVKTGWCDEHHDSLNKGAMTCAIENYRSGFVWKYFMRNPEVLEGMRLAGFQTPFWKRLLPPH